jgi:hypothetical protein
VIRISGRHAWPAALVAWLGVVPVAYHGLARPTADDCADPAALELARFRARTPELRPKVQRPRDGGTPRYGEFDSRLEWKSGPLWRLARTRDLGESYFVPPGHFSLSSPLEEVRVVMHEQDGQRLPVHLRVEEFGGYANLGAHLYVFGGRPVETPLLASLRRTLEQLVGGTLPLTAIVVEGDARVTPDRRHEAALVRWLGAAWARYREVCLR